MENARQALRAHIKMIGWRSRTGKPESYIKPGKDNHITLNVYRDEFPMFKSGKKQMDSYIDNIYKYMEMEWPNTSICANIIFRTKKNMKYTELYP